MTEEVFELWDPAAFERGDEVISLKDVRNDGTYPGAKMGEILIRKGEAGYVHNVGTYLNRFYIYAVEFIDSGRLVGMRAHELEGKAS
ncbi:nitrogen fixation protein NifZ [Paramagnetospirillum kuznetsovii]|uniref:Nitrogen fixation protein NifZ n=1 Tax=Paramagnetospirillum kuznetsovii TaxID=2053833 RepID=A0A364NZK5_9PROT|nr:nitrogen fixation protein NifZ [Paramagnetospirillum kuznetsovii]RAU22347.1 nitrogen fixation protein NifZ [Paramagnetospirillum kuznetsovii]